MRGSEPDLPDFLLVVPNNPSFAFFMIKNVDVNNARSNISSIGKALCILGDSAFTYQVKLLGKHKLI